MTLPLPPVSSGRSAISEQTVQGIAQAVALMLPLPSGPGRR